MKKLSLAILVLAAILSQSVFANLACPAADSLIFTPDYSSGFNSVGKISATINGVSYFSFNPISDSENVTHPQNLLTPGASGPVTSAVFNGVNGADTECLYTYKTFIGQAFYLIMRPAN